MSKKILIIEDDRALRETTAAFLEAEGFRVQQAPDGVQGLKAAEKDKPDLVLLDMMLPAKGGIEVCKALREKGAGVPIIFVSGERKDEIDKVLGLELGADDYVTKPFGQRELLARIHAILRRGRPGPPDIGEFAFGDIAVDFKKHTTLKGKEEVYLTAKEYDLLKLLIRREGEVVDRDTLLNEVWGYEHFPTTRTIDTFIHNLRKKIEKDPSHPRHLITVPWSGYKFQK
jgi:two-component system, OmpR family, response regulator RegX3